MVPENCQELSLPKFLEIRVVTQEPYLLVLRPFDFGVAKLECCLVVSRFTVAGRRSWSTVAPGLEDQFLKSFMG